MKFGAGLLFCLLPMTGVQLLSSLGLQYYIPWTLSLTSFWTSEHIIRSTCGESWVIHVPALDVGIEEGGETTSGLEWALIGGSANSEVASAVADGVVTLLHILGMLVIACYLAFLCLLSLWLLHLSLLMGSGGRPKKADSETRDRGFCWPQSPNCSLRSCSWSCRLSTRDRLSKRNSFCTSYSLVWL